jgi:hypothetical protein
MDTTQIEQFGQQVTVPTLAEMLRIKAVLILKRNATRDYLDFVALADRIGEDGAISALRSFDNIYPQPNGESALQQLQIQLAAPLPYDLDDVNLAEYKQLSWEWRSVSLLRLRHSDLRPDYRMRRRRECLITSFLARSG